MPVSSAAPKLERSQSESAGWTGAHEVEQRDDRAARGVPVPRPARNNHPGAYSTVSSPLAIPASPEELTAASESLAQHVPPRCARRPLRPFWRPGLTEIELCNVCSCQERLRRNGCGQPVHA
eukprot:COSAG01_NODE_28701_length_655_cov_0.555755_1_plen_121_part_10